MVEGRIERSVDNVAKFWHADPYYDRAENSDWLVGFWDPDNIRFPFRRMFNTLDLNVTLELAVGHGRHAAQIIDRVPKLILMDVVQENVAFCKQRFAGRENVACVQNKGADFRPVPDAALTSIYCYDAMVHFEYDVVLSYVADTARVLAPGGRALYHHSNLDAFPGRDHRKNPGGRNFMSQALFLHAASIAGLTVVESVPMDWDAPFTDCLSLLEKPRP
jgi:SAM-dependent methyltransferase